LSKLSIKTKKMAIKDYNSSNFKNAAMDRLSGRFGKGPGDGLKKSSTTSTTSATLANPWSKPRVNAVTAPSVKKPATTPMPAAKPSTTVSTTADKTMAAAAPKKTMKEVRSESKIKVKEAKTQKKLDKINNPKTAEEKQERNKRVALGVGTGAAAVEGALELVKKVKDTFPGKNQGN
jgi:hypothetical protein